MNDVSLITLITIIFSFIILAIRIIMKSKCVSFDLCYGLLKINRDVQLEEKIEELKIQKGINSDNDINENINNIKNILNQK